MCEVIDCDFETEGAVIRNDDESYVKFKLILSEILVIVH